jgi:hypothetical protein
MSRRVPLSSAFFWHTRRIAARVFRARAGILSVVGDVQEINGIAIFAFGQLVVELHFGTELAFHARTLAARGGAK